MARKQNKPARTTPPRITKRQQLADRWAQYLDTIPWNLYLTFTTGYEMTLPTARRNMERFFERLTNEATEQTAGPLFAPGETPADKYAFFWAAEPYDIKEGFHTHALLRCPKAARNYKKLYELWQSVTGENKIKTQLPGYDPQSGRIIDSAKNSRIDLQRYLKSTGANNYVGKYIMKAGTDFDLIFTGPEIYSKKN